MASESFHMSHLEPDQKLHVPEEQNNSSALAQGLSHAPYLCRLLLPRSWRCVIDAGFGSILLMHTVHNLIEELLLLVSQVIYRGRNKIFKEDEEKHLQKY